MKVRDIFSIKKKKKKILNLVLIDLDHLLNKHIKKKKSINFNKLDLK